MDYCNHKCHLRYGVECSPCKSQNKITTKMNTQYTIIKELQERIVTLKTITERNENDYNSLLEKYAKQVNANEELRQKMINSKNILLTAKLQNSANLIKRNIENVVEILQ